MDYSIGLIERDKEIEEKRLMSYINTPKENQSSLHYEHIEDIRNQLVDYERAIVILKQFESFSETDKKTVMTLTNKINYLESLTKIKFNNV